MKLIAHSASADGTSGIPNFCMPRKSFRSNSSPSCSWRYASSTRYTHSVPVKLPTISPIAPQCSTTMKSTVSRIVSRTLAMLAIANATERSSTRKSAVSCW